MPISPHQLEPLYHLAKEAYFNNMTKLTAAKEISRQGGMAVGTANDLVRNLKHMLEGQPYKRRLAGVVTEYYLGVIERDFGGTTLAKALAALWGHIEYYEKVSKTNSLNDRAIHKRFSGGSDRPAT